MAMSFLQASVQDAVKALLQYGALSSELATSCKEVGLTPSILLLSCQTDFGFPEPPPPRAEL